MVGGIREGGDDVRWFGREKWDVAAIIIKGREYLSLIVFQGTARTLRQMKAGWGCSRPRGEAAYRASVLEAGVGIDA